MSITRRGAYRAWQFWQAIWARPLPLEARREVNEVLNEEQLVLFEEQSDAGQQHGYRVMRTLAQAGHDQNDLMIAALLHDVGKNRVRYTWLDRVKVVLAQRFAPGLSRRWAAGKQEGWTMAFVVKESHPEWGAVALEATGGSALSVSLVRRHQEVLLAPCEDNEENRLLALLQWADDLN
jgi:hypothetical protein